jgi:predicted dehydrogenase
MTLRAIVIGTGWAGEGHTTALRAAGVDVVAICGRTPEPAYALAGKLDIQELRFNWRAALDEFQPDIVAIATPAKPNCEIALVAAQQGCHILCDKPLAVNPTEAREMLLAVELAGIKHAYAATLRYSPQFAYVRRLLTEGLIGQLMDIEWMQHDVFSPSPPYHWHNQLSLGGGELNRTFTHQLSMIQFVTGGEVQAASGVGRFLLARDLLTMVIDPEQVNSGEWGAVDGDFGYTVMLQIQTLDGHNVEALVHSSAVSPSAEPNYILFHGKRGTLKVTGPVFWPNQIQHFALANGGWREMPVPEEITASLPQVENFVQRDWNQLCLEFVADIRGQGYRGYPTFRDGWVAAQIIDHVRSGSAWMPVLQHPSS